MIKIDDKYLRFASKLVLYSRLNINFDSKKAQKILFFAFT